MIACPWFPLIDYSTIIVGIPLGIATSFTAWYIVFRVIAPKVRFAEKISEIGGREPRCRVKILNYGFRDILDCEVMAEFRVRGLDRELPKNISVLNIPVYASRFPRLSRLKHRLITFRCYSFDDQAARSLPRDFEKHKDFILV
jgi:hypothetical protein